MWCKMASVIVFATTIIVASVEVSSQELKPVVIITKKDGQMASEQALLKMMSTGEKIVQNSDLIMKSMTETLYAMNETISSYKSSNAILMSQLNFVTSLVANQNSTIQTLSIQLESERNMNRYVTATPGCNLIIGTKY